MISLGRRTVYLMTGEVHARRCGRYIARGVVMHQIDVSRCIAIHYTSDVSRCIVISVSFLMYNTQAISPCACETVSMYIADAHKG